MTAVDTNVVVRLLTADDAVQTEIARQIFCSGPIWIAKTVLLETSWVLESVYEFDIAQIREALVGLLGLRQVHAEDGAAVAAALTMSQNGVGFADALHYYSKPAGVPFASFDRPFVKRAKRFGASDALLLDH